jgi:hypothetical protein
MLESDRNSYHIMEFDSTAALYVSTRKSFCVEDFHRNPQYKSCEGRNEPHLKLANFFNQSILIIKFSREQIHIPATT